ncbi:MAG: PHP domain-containing protein [Deltaproteobacteria bacterium]|nr:PHP domain-containing protein [Deltaproteobacteria bacterium]
MKTFKADLHIHTCLSPCADLDMTPKAIVEKSLGLGLDIVAICDHNSAENVEATVRAGIQRKLCVLPGLEINSREEVHLLAIFESVEKALHMQETVYRYLKGTNRPEFFGDQVVVNEFDEVEGFNDRLLIGAVDLGLQEIVSEVHRQGGLTIASHVDRPSFSIISQLGFIPPDLELDALEITQGMRQRNVSTMGERPIVTSSDAHFLHDVGRAYTPFFLESPNLEEIRMALFGKSGRKVGT